jgi:protein HEXIM1/2
MCHGLAAFQTKLGSMSETEDTKHNRRESEASQRSGSSSGGERGTEDQTTPARKRRHRRGKHRRRWKPYSKMTPEERQQAESREAARAAKRERDLMGKPAAPWNTTQFLMEDAGCGEFKLDSVSRTLSLGSGSASDEGGLESPGESGVESGVFWNRDYDMVVADYEKVVAEIEEEELRGLSREELVKLCLQLRAELRTLREEGSNQTQPVENSGE